MKLVLNLIIISLICISSSAISSTLCEQNFTLLGRTKGETPVFLIMQDLSGECESSKLLEIALLPGGAKKLSLDFDEKGTWKWFSDGIPSLRTEPFLSVEQINGIWKISDNMWKIKNPIENDILKKEVLKEPIIIASKWNEEKGTKGIQLPIFNDLKTELIYYLPAGFYVNYTIDKIFYFKKSGYIIVFTNQDRKGPGLDTMHGFLILKIL